MCAGGKKTRKLNQANKFHIIISPRRLYTKHIPAGGKKTWKINQANKIHIIISPRRLYETHSCYTVNIMWYCLLDSKVILLQRREK